MRERAATLNDVDDASDQSCSQEELRAQLGLMLEGLPLGPPLTAMQRELITFAVHATPTTLDGAGITRHAEQALELGASPAQLEEVILFVSAIGIHTVIEGTRRLGNLLRERAVPIMQDPLDDGRRRLLDTHVGVGMEAYEAAVPGFFDALVRLSPTGFEGFFAYRGLTAHEPQIDPLTRELIASAVDALPTHRFLPTLRLHVIKAVELGAGGEMLSSVFEIAAHAPQHPGVRGQVPA